MPQSDPVLAMLTEGPRQQLAIAVLSTLKPARHRKL
jgi:hypothetical protein